MRLWDLTVLYVLIGAGWAVFAWVRPARGAWERLVDASVVFVVWPLYAPFLLAPREAASTPGLDLESRLADAKQKVDEIDRVLSMPELSETLACAKHDALLRQGDLGAAAVVARRIDNIRRLGEIRARAVRELLEIEEVVARERVQSEVLRLSARDGTAVLLEELAIRLEGLDELVEAELEQMGAPPTG